MTTKIPVEMVESLTGILAQLVLPEVGDFCFSHRASKTGWLKCDAGAVSRTTYAALFDEIGTTYGAGDGSTTFNLPPAGRTLVAAGDADGLTSRDVGDTGGAETHTLSAAEIPAHSHPIAVGGGATGAGASLNYWQGPGPASGMSTQNNVGGGGAHNNMPPFIAENLFIFAGV